MEIQTGPRPVYVSVKGGRYEIDRREGGRVYVCPAGGGFQFSIPEAEFESDFSIAPPPKFVPGQAYLDDGHRYDCYATEVAWNGWAMPHFVREVGERLAEHTNKDMDSKLIFNSLDDRFEFHTPDQDDWDGPELYPAAWIDVDGKYIKVYGIGVRFWTWDFKADGD